MRASDDATATRIAAPLDRSVFERKDLIFGTEIGAWDLDGGIAVNQPVARQSVVAARTHLIRWGVWKKFDYLQQGQADSMTVEQFNSAIDGIRDLGATPLLKLPPIWDQQCDAAPDYWNTEWLREVVKQAGSRVQLYEFGNEPDKQCGWTAERYASEWNRVVPDLKKYARSMGFEIYVGGPAHANTNPESVAYVEDFLTRVRDTYVATGDADVVPDFVSLHTYPNATDDPTLADILRRIEYWGGQIDQLRTGIAKIWDGLSLDGEPIGTRIKIADSEYNYTIDNSDARAADPAFVQPYVAAMIRMLREHDVWAANLFTIASHEGGAMDLLNLDGSPKPLYDAFRAESTADPLNTAPPTVDVQATTHQAPPGSYRITSPRLSTHDPGEVLYAFVASSGDPDQCIARVYGGGLHWRRVAQANDRPGTSEVWRAVAPSALTDVAVTAVREETASAGSLTVVAFRDADPARTGAVAVASGSDDTHAGVSLTTTTAHALVWGVGNDWDGAHSRVVGAGQVMVDEYVEDEWGDSYWLQRRSGFVAMPGTEVRLDTASSWTGNRHRWNFAAVEIPAAG
ncbi:hypothetical protein [Flindersiella endophytica]